MAEQTLEVAERVAELVHIPSVNPLQAGPKSGDGAEHELSAWFANRAEDLGAAVTTDAILDQRHNVYAQFPGRTDRVITIDVHLDTVGVEHMTDDPFDGRIEDGRVYGRGSVDTKASLAIVLHLLAELRADGAQPQPTVNLVGTIGEESGGLIGAIGYRDWLNANNSHIDQLIVAEPTLCAPVYAHKGGCGVSISLHGVAAHSSQPALGQNAISGAARVVAAIDHEQVRLQQNTPSTPVGNGTVSVVEVEGGLAQNIIPDHCRLHVDRRIAPGERVGEEFQRLSGIIKAAADPLRAEVDIADNFAVDAFYQDPDSPLIAHLGQLGEAKPEVAGYGSNALFYADIASEIVVFGPGSIEQAHKAVEWIDLSEIQRATDIYRALLGVG